MRRVNYLMMAAGAAAMAMLGSNARASGSYEADVLPTDANPAWQQIYFDGSSSVSGGVLTLSTSATTESLAYRLFGGSGQSWDPEGKVSSTVDVGLKVDAQNGGAARAGDIFIGTGSAVWLFRFATTWISEEIAGGGFAATTDDAFHNYQFAITGASGPLNVYVDGGTTPAATFAGTPVSNSVYNRIDFGDTLDGDAGTIQWDYIRWNNVLSQQWAVDKSGDWNSAGNWATGIPNGVDAVAPFLGAITAPRTVYTDTAVTVGTIKFDNANSYQITGQGSLRIETSTGNGSVDVVQGSHKINLPLTFASSTDVTIAGGATLTIADPATISAGKTVTKNGNLLIQAPLTLEAGASLVLASGPTSAFGAPAIGTGAKIDVKNNSMTIDYRGQATPAATINSQLASGYASGAWNGEGINTSSAVANQTALGWKDDAATQSILVKYTYYGDANLDGQVDISDLGALATAWQTSAVWSQGDFDYSGFVDISDLGKLATNWQLGVGSPLGPSFDEALASVGLAGVSVPEPSTLGLLSLGVVGLLKRRRPV